MTTRRTPFQPRSGGTDGGEGKGEGRVSNGTEQKRRAKKMRVKMSDGSRQKNNNGQAWSSNINISKQRQKAAPTRSSSHAKSKLRSPPPLPLRTPSKREGGSKKYGEWSETMSDVMPTEKKKKNKKQKKVERGKARRARPRDVQATQLLIREDAKRGKHTTSPQRGGAAAILSSSWSCKFCSNNKFAGLVFCV